MIEQVTRDGALSGLRGTGPGQRAPGGALRRPPRLRHRDVAGLEEASDALCGPSGVRRQTWMIEDHRIAAKSCLLTTRAAKWATRQVGGGRTVSEVAAELACDWHTVNDAVTTYGSALLAADRKRLNQTSAIGLDETSFIKLASKRAGATTPPRWPTSRTTRSSTSCPTRKYTDVAGWIDKQPQAWKERIDYGALDMSATYAAVYSVMLPKAAQVVDPFHVISLANRCLDSVRRRVQIEQLGHRGRRDDPLYRARRVLLMGEEKLDAEATSACAHSSSWGSSAEVAMPIGSRSASVTSIERRDPDGGRDDTRRAPRPLPATGHAAGDPKARTHHRRPGSTRSPTSTWPGSPTARPRRSTT